MNNRPHTAQYPLPIPRWMDTADKACEDDGADCHRAALGLSDALTYYIGALAVASYTQALFTEQIEADPTLNRSLRSLRRILPGQWLLWAGRGLSAVPAS